MHALSLVSYRFWNAASEFLYDTIYIRRTEGARSLAASPHALEALQKWTKHLIIVPHFDEGLFHADFTSLTQEFGQLMETILAQCVKLDSVILRADVMSKRLGVNDHWMKICRAVPHGCRHLDIDDDMFGPVVWEPRHLMQSKFDYFLSSLRLTAVQDSHEYTFENATHLALYSWPIASKWNLPTLTNLYITYFPNLPRSYTFWLMPKPTLELLHFGHATDIGAFADFPRLAAQAVPNIRALEYYYYGGSEMPWSPSELPASLKEVTLKTFHHPEKGRKQGQLFDLDDAKEGLRLTPAALERWAGLARHLASYAVRPTILVPIDPPLDKLLSVIQPILTEHGADADFAVSS